VAAVQTKMVCCDAEDFTSPTSSSLEASRTPSICYLVVIFAAMDVVWFSLHISLALPFRTRLE